MEPKRIASFLRSLRFRLTPDILFLLICLLVGGAFSIYIPFGAGFDEEAHLARIWEMSSLHLLPNSTARKNSALIPQTFINLSYQRRYFLSPAQDLLQPPISTQPIDRLALFPYRTHSVYPPVIFLPQAFVAGVVWRILHLPVIPGAVITRLAGLLVYILGIFMAIRLLPVGKWVLGILAISPMVLFQAATLNADGYTVAVCFLFTGYTLKVYGDQPAPIDRSQVIALMALAIAIGLAKPFTFVVLPLLLVLPFRRFSNKGWFIALWGTALLAVAVSLGWSLMVSRGPGFAGLDSSTGLLSHLRLAIANPIDFLGFYVRGIYLMLPEYYREWQGVYGYQVGIVPQAVYWLYPAALLGEMMAESRPIAGSWRARLQIVGIFLISTAALIFWIYLFYYRVGVYTINDLQGRYFIPLTPLLFLPLSGWISIPELWRKIIRGLSILLVFGALGYYSFGMYATYYTICDSSLYTGAPCYQPVYKNIDKYNSPSIEINSTQHVSQTFRDNCGKLEGVQVWIKSVQPGGQGNLRFELLDEAGIVISSIDAPIANLRGASYLTLPVSPPAGENGNKYRLRLSSPDAQVGQGVLVATSTDVQYIPGKLFVNNQRKPADLIFKYVCVDPWKQISLPIQSTDSNPY